MFKPKRFQPVCIILLVVLFLIISTGCERTSDTQAVLPINWSTYRDIPGVSAEEITAIEALKEQFDYFTYGMLFSTESFYDKDGKIEGFAAFVCEWLTKLFGIPFIPENHTWTALLNGLEDRTIDFTGYLMPTEGRRRTYSMTDPIAQRVVKYFRLRDSTSIQEIRNERLPRYALVTDAATTHNIFQFAVNAFEPVYVEVYTDAYELMINGEADALVTVGVNETGFGGDVIAEDFMPPIFASTSFATQNPALQPFINIVQKALDNGAIHHLNELYNQGYMEYTRHKLITRLSTEELDFLQTNPVILFGAETTNYPLSFYNTRYNEWQGIAFDVLREVEVLTGLEFTVGNTLGTPWAVLYQMLEAGEIHIISELLRTPGREGRFLWPDYPLFIDQSALISKNEHRNISIHEVMSMKVGFSEDSAHAELFRRWFPDHQNAIGYIAPGEAFAALMNGEVDMVMASVINLLDLTHYQELAGFKANVVFDNTLESTFGFNKDEVLLYSIVAKALDMIDIQSISGQWLRRTYDYRIKLAEAQRPWIAGTVLMLGLVIFVMTFLYIKNRKMRLVFSEQAARLTVTNKRIETIISNLPGMVFQQLYNPPDYTYTYVSEGCRELTGYTAEELVGNSSVTFLGSMHPDDSNHIEKLSAATLPYGLPFETTFRITTRDGLIKWVWERSRVIEKNPDGTPHLIEGYYADVTEQRQYQAAELANRAKSVFLANMSHEMRTPMNVVVGLTDLMLEEDDLAVNLKENLKRISTAGNTLLGLINDVLDISKIEAGKLELMPIVYEVPSLVNDIINLNVIRIEEKPITFLLDIDENLPYSLCGDDLRVKQIINNILSNAFKYTQQGTVTLGMSTEQSGKDIWVSVYVRDTGIGIREDDLKKLFTSYAQVDTRTNRAIEGTGLGLAITKQLAEMMDGEITAESEYGTGSVFRVRFRQGFVDDTNIGPVISKNLRDFRFSEDKQKAKKKLVRPDLSYARVLVVDDMQTNLDVATGLLGKYKMRVDCVLSGQEAIEQIRSGNPVYDAIFMDHMMPEMDGLEAAVRIRDLDTEYARKIPLIALTANAIQGTEDLFYANGFQAFLSKPINIMQLDAVIRKWIAK